ncbi:hypothetical protein IW140_000329 [Coemansia sp. RSA 1813]|nr:hypothetical protein LPJ74_000246 [Coemansia sp. RSA 1843]KAJ2573284.1 hypothetical protein IW140_000329 [Coemansia sp. RSA 1813]
MSSQTPALMPAMARQATLCAVCMDEITKDFYKAPCGHRLHNDCVADLRNAQADVKCPNCRAPLVETTLLLHLEEGIARGLQAYERTPLYTKIPDMAK